MIKDSVRYTLTVVEEHANALAMIYTANGFSKDVVDFKDFEDFELGPSCLVLFLVPLLGRLYW